MGLNPVQVSKQEYLMGLRSAHYERVQTLRDYDDGDTPSLLTDRQKIQIAGEDNGSPAHDPEVRLNICKVTNQVPVNRLDVQDISVTAEGDDELSERLSKLIWKWWKKNRLDEGQKNAYYNAHRDGDSFGVCYYEEYPRISINQVYDGENSGADVFYTDGDPLRPESAVKIWIAEESDTKKIRRKNIYYADRVEKWISDGGMTGAFSNADWRPLRYGDTDYTDDLVEMPSLARPDVTATIVWWTETGTERAPGMGIPVKHFKHAADGAEYGVSNIDPIVPEGQDAVNRSANDVQAGAALSGFKVRWATGYDPDIQKLYVAPGTTWYNRDPNSAFGEFSETDLRQLIEVKDTFIKDCATLTATPLTYFNLSGVIPAEGTQQSLEMALLAKVQSDQVAMGNTWEDVVRMWLKMEKTWGTELRDVTEDQIDDLDINCVWESAKVRNELEDTTIAEKHKQMGVPDRFVFRRLGYTEDEIDQMMTEKDRKRNAVIGQLGQRVQQMEVEAETQPVTQGSNNGANASTDSITTE